MLLRLDQTSLPSVPIESICGLKALEELNLESIKLTTQDIKQLLSSQQRLKKLTVSRAELDTETMQLLATKESLLDLSLIDCSLDDELLTAFADKQPQQLSHLDLRSSKVGDKGLRNLVQKLPPAASD